MVKATLATTGIHYEGTPPSDRNTISQKAATFKITAIKTSHYTWQKKPDQSWNKVLMCQASN
jgi:hypothetical protein